MRSHSARPKTLLSISMFALSFAVLHIMILYVIIIKIFYTYAAPGITFYPNLNMTAPFFKADHPLCGAAPKGEK